MAEKISALTAEPLDKILPFVQDYFDGTFKQLFNKAEATLSGASQARRLFGLVTGAQGAGVGEKATQQRNAAARKRSGKGAGDSGNQLGFDGEGFRLAPIATLDRLAADIERRKRDPEARRKIFESMQQAMNTLRTRWSETQQRWNGTSPPIVEQRSKTDPLSPRSPSRQ